MLNRLQVTIDKEMHRELGIFIHVIVSRGDGNDLHVRRQIPENDFESYFDYVWKVCKHLLDEALEKESKNEFQDKQ